MSQSARTEIDIGRFYAPQPVQRKFHASEARYPLLEGGRGGGKSTALLWEAISQCLRVPGANCLLLRRTLTAMEKGGIEDLFKRQVPRSIYRSYNAAKHVITFHKGSSLFFGHVKTDADLLQYQDAEFLFIGWEELTQFTYAQWDFLKGSNRCPIKTYWHKECEYAVRAPHGRGHQPTLWITKKPVGEMAVKTPGIASTDKVSPGSIRSPRPPTRHK
jgi:hypothetical protein